MRPDQSCYWTIAALVVVTVALMPATAEARAEQRRQGNVFGINLGWEPGWDTTGTVRLLGIARDLVGEWGYLRHGISPRSNSKVEDLRRSIAMIRAHHLIPIVGGAYPDKQFLEPGKPYPKLDTDGTMRAAARHAGKKNVRSLAGLRCLCTTMYRIDVPHLLWSLDELAAGRVANRIRVDEQTRRDAVTALQRMLDNVSAQPIGGK